MLTIIVAWAVPCGSIWSIIPVVSNMFCPVWGTALVVIGIFAYMVMLIWIVSMVF